MIPERGPRTAFFWSEREGALRLYAFASLRLYAFTSLRLYVFTSLRLHVSTSLRLYAFTSLRLSQPGWGPRRGPHGGHTGDQTGHRFWLGRPGTRGPDGGHTGARRGPHGRPNGPPILDRAPHDPTYQESRNPLSARCSGNSAYLSS